MSRDALDEKSEKIINIAQEESALSAATAPANVEERKPLPPLSAYTKFSFFVSSMSIRYKIAGALVLILVLAIASLGMVTFSKQKSILEEELEKRAAVIVQQLAGVGKECLMTKDDLLAFSTIKDLQKNSGVIYAMILDGQGTIFVHSKLTEKGKTLSAPLDKNTLAAKQILFQKTVYNSESAIDAAMPITILYHEKNIRVGTARIGLSEKELYDAISKQKMIYFWISVIFVAIGLLIAVALSKVLTGPIYTLAVGMQIVASGDLNQQLKVAYKDEIGKLTESFNQMVLSLREKFYMEKYLSHSTLKRIRKARDTSDLKLGGERKYVTALFSDVRGFTSMSEQMSPEEVVEVLNVYLNMQAGIIGSRGGIVDKYVGDEIMAIFEGKDQELNAVRAAVEIQRFGKTLNRARTTLGKKQMSVGIGINSGDVVMGNMGSQERMTYTAIGDNINLAARLCSAAGAGQIVITKQVADELGREATLKKMEPITVKGRETLVEVFEATSASRVSRQAMRRNIHMSIQFHLEGLAEEVHDAVLTNAGPGGALLQVSGPLGVGSQIMLHIDDQSLKHLNGVKAVVRHTRKEENHYYIRVTFEGLSEMAQAMTIDWVHQI